MLATWAAIPGDWAGTLEESSKIVQEGFHFGAGVGVAFFCGGGDAGGEDSASFVGAGFAGQELGVHEVRRDVVGVAIQKSAEVGVGGGGITGVHALHGQAVAGEGVAGLLRYEVFEHLAAGFLLVGHGRLSYYTENATKPQEVDEWVVSHEKVGGTARVYGTKRESSCIFRPAAMECLRYP